ncbi:DUF6311 domain-containing protein [Pseudoduganella chitinolytica]|uniref:DUF6311 domain-containing protein n=1 Tax=Pseudoduganella chitinolytica TaxID=34070 RepID=A0ABY8BCM7_9BURK|nr:DUF6311 domain-containing protein [Pseudoduganella chitinolytica]WEF32928.1 DUF6311 domain-containing protein [Pseudoduganella chitinolytica]
MNTSTPQATWSGSMVRPATTAWWSASGPLGLLCAGAIGCAFACWLFSLALLDGTLPFWLREGADTSQYLAGFNAFVREPWHWPLLRIESLNAPEGTLATFVDAVPLYAMLWKLFEHGPDTPFRNPFGLYLALCFVLQGVGAWWICREANTRRWTVLLAMTLLLVSFPALTFRIAHTSLMAQWLLLFALAIYLRGTARGRIAAGAWIALLPCAFYLNIYLFAMTCALFAADVWRQVRRGPARPAVIAAGGAAGLLLLTMCATMLPLPAGVGSREWGFGFYSMNMLAPFTGGNLLMLEHALGTEGQGEGYNYLGVFVLALAGWGIYMKRGADPAFWRRHRPLLAILVLLTLYALSNAIYIGPVKLLSTKVPPGLDAVTSTFRSSGRFFWPVGYAVIVFAVLAAARHLSAQRAALVLAAVVVLQFWDLQPHHERARGAVAESTPAIIDAPRWQAFLGPDIKALNYYPPFRCGNAPPSAGLVPTMLFAVKHHYTLSTGYIARAAKPCDQYGAEIATLPATTAVVFDKAAFPEQEEANRLMGAGARCADLGIGWVCRRDANNPRENKQ